MSRTDDLFALPGKRVARDPRGKKPRVHFFGTLPFDDGTRVNQKEGQRFGAQPSYVNDTPHNPQPIALRPTVVALISVNGGVGRSTLATALSSGLRRMGKSVVALDLDPQNALRQHFGVDHERAGVGGGSLLKTPWATLLQAGFSGCQVLPFGDTDTPQKENLQRWLAREPQWLVRHLSALALSEAHTVIIDTPAGNNVYLHQALSVADIVLVVAQPNAACLGTLDQLDALLAPHLEREPAPRCHFVINQLDEHSTFNLGMLDAFKLRRSEYPLAVVHRDPVFSEALAFATDPLDSKAPSPARDDIGDLCRLLVTRKSTA
ncbi:MULTISPECIES: cellulose biosynthesis protein BcsQ [Pseudomonas]|jgi:cellulose synthase operon protein YhjQ|uniref:Cellulose synthase operon protein YhjQ n=2 Tax=Pseudomonas TaxID=286 RepID=A0A4Y9TIM3_PSEFL|nr:MULTISPECIES: cellulose biosynthesis protein BcsQ [Pseudomonas]CRM94703.1 cell division protein [Pseudomonas sp. 22 E 5]MCX9152231.1 cellulose biosynthesis protein BcsQ [Pseudomonas sp. TB1-B1]QXH67823.1 cellulose synthase operon protein YhjQ [Pseudomonas asgharzadehiana]TFW43981.1 cellulose synthase operon protein YhjQ [Pseudomonas fluorescens]TKJ61507.1 cellulose synthase operon protein YhjQ [Pseudomonas sp. CFBP13506]